MRAHPRSISVIIATYNRASLLDECLAHLRQQRFDPGDEVTIGRAPTCTATLDDNYLSQLHARVFRRDGVVHVEDLGSTNGTFVNGGRVRGTVQLGDGDNIDFAGNRMTFHMGATSPAAVPAGPGTRVEVAVGPSAGVDVAASEGALEGAEGQPIWLVKGEPIVGRVPGVDLTIPDEFVSRQHARIQRVGGQFVVTDLGSSNGTYVNEQRLTEAYSLQPGDRVRFGHTSFVFRRPTDVAPRGAMAAFPMPVVQASGGPVTIQVENVYKSYMTGDGEIPILRGVSLQIRQGEFVSLVGPSGSGKSTLINMMTGIDLPDSGKIRVVGQALDELNDNKLARWRGNNIGLIFQFFPLLPTLTALENVMLPLDFCPQYSGGTGTQRAMDCLQLVGMDGCGGRLPRARSHEIPLPAAYRRAISGELFLQQPIPV